MISKTAGLFLFLVLVGSSSAAQRHVSESDTQRTLIEFQNPSVSNACSVARAAAYRRCASSCGALGVRSFSSGACGEGAVCLCGGGSTNPPSPEPIEN